MPDRPPVKLICWRPFSSTFIVRSTDLPLAEVTPGGGSVADSTRFQPPIAPASRWRRTWRSVPGSGNT